MQKDKIFSKPLSTVRPFQFDENVARVFPDMISRSVPGYDLILTVLESITEKYVQEGSNLYDLGCSLGASTLAMMHGINKKNCRIIAVDNSRPMVDKAKSTLDLYHSPAEIQLVCDDLRNINMENASVVVMNFTLQFIEPENRRKILRDIYKGLMPGGVLVLSEKICFEDNNQQALNDELHLNFKKQQGYSNLEISQKRSSLENVLIRDTLETHEKRIREVGFSVFEMWFRCYNFVSMLAVK
ncbi:MAG: carboxy-S-adenosyl-L-methionine synthase CmoA [Candidatus Marinimicrobia bacterium]|nr:carboxy-S-adenosyl-L-methionine synthase CmoA [Candidatus Neomarinimicrobiota bacterium]